LASFTSGAAAGQGAGAPILVAGVHSITSSARTSSPVGNAIPSAFAVLGEGQLDSCSLLDR
jgi:hypothetical protein